MRHDPEPVNLYVKQQDNLFNQGKAERITAYEYLLLLHFLEWLRDRYEIKQDSFPIDVSVD